MSINPDLAVPTPARLLMLGLEGSGKTTLLHKLKFGEAINIIPTFGFNVEGVDYKDVKFNVRIPRANT